MKFALYKKPVPEPEPEPTPAPFPEPSKPSSGGHSHSHTPKLEVKPEPATESSTPLLKCGKAVIEKENVDDEDKLNSKTLSSFNLNIGQRGGWLINESGLYSLVLSSKLPRAKRTAIKLRRAASMIYTVRPMRAPCLR